MPPMDSFSADAFAASVRPVTVDLYTTAYRVSGSVLTRFSRVAEIVNQLSSTHLRVERATISEYVAPAGTLAAPAALVALDEIILLVAPEADGSPRPEMRIPKRPVRAQLAVPPFRVTGLIHVTQGSRPVDGLLNLADRFVAMTEVTIDCAGFPELGRTVAAAAIRRDRAHVLLVADDEDPDRLLAEVIDEETAEAWLREPEQAHRP
jgi:hypothetical protein